MCFLHLVRYSKLGLFVIALVTAIINFQFCHRLFRLIEISSATILIFSIVLISS